VIPNHAPFSLPHPRTDAVNPPGATQPPPVHFCYSLKEVSEATSLKRGLLYALAAKGILKLTKAGRRTVVTPADLNEMLRRLQEEAGGK